MPLYQIWTDRGSEVEHEQGTEDATEEQYAV